MIMKKCHKCGDVYELFNKDGLTYSIEGIIFRKIDGKTDAMNTMRTIFVFPVRINYSSG